MKTVFVKVLKKKNVICSDSQSVIAIGNFDGLHLGHQKIIEKMLEIAEQEKLPAFLLTFEPYPQAYFNPTNKNARLSSLREKTLFLKRKYPLLKGICMLKFNQALAHCSPQEFIKEYLIYPLNPSHIVIGEDFKFGRQRSGDSKDLKRFFCVETVPSIFFESRRMSSTWLREILVNADFNLAEILLGRWYSIVGKVIEGRKLGRTLGVPTANIALSSRVFSFQGVYAVKIKFQNQSWNGVANIGVRPTIDNSGKAFLEVHLFDFNQSLYGQYIEVFFLHKLRDEKRFESLSLLKSQIQRDIEMARHLLE